MSRTTEQRLGDIALVLTTVGALLFIAIVWSALDVADGRSKTFWSFVGLSLAQSLYPVFAAACLYNWTDDVRKRLIGNGIVLVLAVLGLVTLASAVLGQDDGSTRPGFATYLLQAAWFLMALVGVGLVRGVVPTLVRTYVADDHGDDEAEPRDEN